MRVAIGSDHAGFELKEQLKKDLDRIGCEYRDVGTHDLRAADYPDSAEAVGLAVIQHQAERGIIICGSGVGASIVANKLPGIRAGLCHDTYSAKQGVEHDDMNVLVLGARVIEPATAAKLMHQFLSANFSHEARHVRRLNKLRAIEARYQVEPDSGKRRS